jgi:hypothetical protein
MIESILMYGEKIWGWKKQEDVEKMQEKYLRVVLGVDRETPERQSLKTKRMEGRSAGEKRKKSRRRRERNTTRETGIPVKKWKE